MNICLYKPEIPQNTGNIGRLSVCTGSRLHIIGEPSFSLSESAVKRAGLDYWPRLDLTLHSEWKAFREHFSNSESRILLITKFAKHSYADFNYRMDDCVVFGQETSGLPDEIVNEIQTCCPENILRIPVVEDCRSLNLGNAVGIVLFEALRQNQFTGLKQSYS
ncbi:MAG: tRNA (cytidine(34)-2'-O)-methyltransferase [Spirochaetia bacterium]|nr:tRNA (cytidine(34)-2'-O)-methyltransferase [Spirochaetia bacterium]